MISRSSVRITKNTRQCSIATFPSDCAFKQDPRERHSVLPWLEDMPAVAILDSWSGRSSPTPNIGRGKSQLNMIAAQASQLPVTIQAGTSTISRITYLSIFGPKLVNNYLNNTRNCLWSINRMSIIFTFIYYKYTSSQALLKITSGVKVVIYYQMNAEMIKSLAHQNRTIAIASDFRVDGAKSPEIPQQEGVLGDQKSQPEIADR